MDKETLVKIIREELEAMLKERELTPSEKRKKEEFVLALKQNIPYLKKKYGNRWKDVLYAIATKQAKGGE